MMDNNTIQLALPLEELGGSTTLPIQLLLVGAVRQAFWIHQSDAPNYEEVLHKVIDLAPKLMPADGELAKSYISAAVRLYKQRAVAQSKGRKIVAPTSLIDKDMEQCKKDLETAQEKKQSKDAIETELNRLVRVRARLDVEKWTENKTIERDADIPEGCSKILEKGQGFKLYSDNKKPRFLAVRVLHPDKAEDVTGVDLVYEVYRRRGTDVEVRIIAVQYKMLHKKDLYTSDAKNLPKQIDAMLTYYCDGDKCSTPQTYVPEKLYRMPHCCAFLRVTDSIQTKEGWYLTDGQHLRVCDVKKLMEETDKGNQVLRMSAISESSISQESFQELFRNDMIGSRWMSTAELNDWYKTAKIFEATDRIIAHVKDFTR
jgi:hypothetical protein